MDELRHELKALIIETLKLEDMTTNEIGDDEPLFKEGLGLDSIDALELAVALEQRYRVSIPDQETGKQAFASVSSLATFVSDNRQDL